MDKKALYKLTYGLFVLTSGLAGEDGGCIINTAGQVTSTPNRISIAVNKTNYTCELIQRSGMFNISVLSEAADFSLFQRFGFQSGRTVNKFAGFAGNRFGHAYAVYRVGGGHGGALGGAFRFLYLLSGAYQTAAAEN